MFIVIALVLVFSATFMLYINYQIGKNNKLADLIEEFSIPTEMIPIKTFVDDCIKMISKQGLSLLGAQNGIVKRNGLNIGGFHVNYAYNKTIAVQTLIQLESELSSYMTSQLLKCIDDFEVFQGKDIETGDMKIDVKSNIENVDFTVDFPITLTTNNNQHYLKTFIVSQPIRLKKLHEAMAIISQFYSTQYQYELYKYLGTLDMNASVYGLGNDVVFTFEDNRNKEEEPYVYAFAVQMEGKISNI